MSYAIRRGNEDNGSRTTPSRLAREAFPSAVSRRSRLATCMRGGIGTTLSRWSRCEVELVHPKRRIAIRVAGAMLSSNRCRPSMRNATGLQATGSLCDFSCSGGAILVAPDMRRRLG